MSLYEMGINLKQHVDKMPHCYTKRTNVSSDTVIQDTFYTYGRTTWNPNAKKWGVLQIYKKQLNVQLDFPFGSIDGDAIAATLELPRRNRTDRATGLRPGEGKSSRPFVSFYKWMHRITRC